MSTEYKGRGIKLYFLTDLIISDKDKHSLKQFFAGILHGVFTVADVECTTADVEYATEEHENRDLSTIKVFCPEANFNVKKDDISKFYTSLFRMIFTSTKEYLNSNHYKLLGYEFQFVHQMYPPEPKNIMPLVSINLPDMELDSLS